MNSQYTVLLEKIDSFIRKYYKNDLLRGTLIATALLLAFYLTAILLEYFGNFDTAIRTFMFYSLLITISAVSVKWIVIPLFKLYKLGNIISHEKAAEIIGKHFPEVEDKLLNVIQLQKDIDETSANIGLLEAGINQKIAQLNPVPFTSAINFSENKKYLKYALPPILLFAFILLASPGIITQSTNRIINHAAYFQKQAPFSFLLQNNSLEVLQNEDFTVSLEINGNELPSEVFIELENNRFRMKKEANSLFVHVFKNVQKNIDFRFVADEFYSSDYLLNALPRPIILNFNISLRYPAYLNKKNESISNTGDLLIPAGTVVSWNFKTKDTETMSLGFSDTSVALKSTNPDEYAFSHTFLQNTSYYLKTTNRYVKNSDSVLYSVNVIPDLHPTIEVEEKQDSLTNKRRYFNGLVKDDYGFKSLYFKYRFVKSSDSLKVPEKQLSEKLNIPSQTTQFQFFHFWDLLPLNINAGEEIEYYFEIWDNDGVNGSKSAVSQKKIFKAPSLKELDEKQEQGNQKIKEELQASINEAKKLQREFDKLNKKLLDKKTLSWDDKKQVKDLLEKQKSLEEKLNKIQNENSKIQKEQSEYKELDQEILDKQKQLQELFEEIMTPEMKKLFEELEKMLENLDKNKLQEMLENMQLNNRDIEKELDRSLEIFKQIEFEQKLKDAISELDKLAEEQEKLSEQTKENKNESADKLKNNQDSLTSKLDDFSKKMDELEKKNSELQHPNNMEKTDAEEQQIKQEMQNSSDQLQQNNKKKASQSQKKASEQMKELSDKLKKMQGEMQMDAQEEDLNAMRQLLENLVTLSFEQEDLMAELKKTDKRDPKYVKIGQQQKKLKDDAKMIEDSLFALSKRVIEIQPIINREISAINQNLEKAIGYVTETYANENNKPLALSRQQFVMTHTNNLALLFDEIIQQMQAQMSSQKFGSASCNKPGSGSPSPANMRKLQEQLNKQMQQMKEEMGKNPGGEKGKGGMSEKLAKMAAEQEAIRNELQKMAGQMEKEGNSGGKGKMDELSKLMEQTETDLVNRRITEQTLKRQQEILTRLLESEKAEREREMDEKRESKEGKNEKSGNPEQFFEYNMLKQKEAELLRTVPPALSPFYKNKVNEYFNQFNNQ